MCFMEDTNHFFTCNVQTLCNRLQKQWNGSVNIDSLVKQKAKTKNLRCNINATFLLTKMKTLQGHSVTNLQCQQR